jgi:formamidopyrimidine-DNA glycosylase
MELQFASQEVNPMPELPEVEVIRRGLFAHLQGRKIESIGYNGKKLRTAVPIELMRDRLYGATITEVGRRAKYLLFPTDRLDLLIIHLGMTGNLGLFRQGSPAATHDHLSLRLNNGMELRYNDTRRFGSVHLLTEKETEAIEDTFFSTTGPEPFSDSCSAKYLKKRAAGSTQAVKTFIMNSSIVAGVGNVYANESLFSANIHPLTPAGKLTLKEWQHLIDQIRKILTWAIKCGGSTISDFINASGKRGYFQANFRVYGKNGEPCKSCSASLEKTVINGRASFFCPRCQRQKK